MKLVLDVLDVRDILPPPKLKNVKNAIDQEMLLKMETLLNMFIAKAFHTPLWRYERHMIFNTLLPLHKTTYLPVIIDLVTNCIEEIINIEPSILERYVHILLYKIWPTRSSVKQVCLQHELKTLVKLSDKYNNTDILKLIYHKNIIYQIMLIYIYKRI